MINLRKHDPTSPFLLGGHTDGDIVSEGKQESFIDRQLSFF
jgi:hypothetical protein